MVWEIEKVMENVNGNYTAEECKNLCLGRCDYYWSNPDRGICGFYYALNETVKPCICECGEGGEMCEVLISTYITTIIIIYYTTF